jgi:hypothetical protein
VPIARSDAVTRDHLEFDATSDEAVRRPREVEGIDVLAGLQLDPAAAVPCIMPPSTSTSMPETNDAASDKR